MQSNTKQTSWTIGAASDCDIVVDEPTVSGHHCCLTQTEAGFVLQDLNSTNGTFVNGNRIQQPQSVQSQDRVTLGKSVPLPWPQVASSEGDDAPATANGDERLRLPADSRPIASIVIAAIVMLLVLAMVFREAETDRTNDAPAETVATPTGNELEAPKPTDEERSMQIEPGASLYLVLVKDAEQAQVWRLGTAWAVSAHQLVTTASIVKTIEKLEGEYPVVTVWSPHSGKQYSVPTARMRVHGRFDGAFNRARAAQGEFERLEEQLQAKLKQSQPPNAAELDNLKSKLVHSDAEFVEAENEASHFDIGLLEVSEQLPAALSLAVADTPLHSHDPITLHGIPFPTTNLQQRPDAQQQLAHLQGHISRLPKLDGQDDLFRLEIETRSVLIGQVEDSPFAHEWWVGGPVMNSAGQVIAVCSRLTPSVTQRDQRPKGDRHDAVFVKCVRELISATQSD